jgi:S-(hydroxymethyl)mycothiol dehydrogenase
VAGGPAGRPGRLDLDRFVSATITIDEVEDAFAVMHCGDVLRSIVVFSLSRTVVD